MWFKISETPPPNRVEVETKVSDARGERNFAVLRYDPDHKMWWWGGSYVYYTPTHWRFKDAT
jgi:hypothetical protein